ncbi:meiotic recombination protein REC8 homolog [Octopus sinensis]|uniref:Meiotic recombination protein REC8 homolog n=1 Tax=Octopus sinensis TaxID=2607531 RepID=A0A7E6FCQ5_9MOLL|nr:meiotic recombination protein REC8 homolog [Octopus sinensis]
MPEDQLRMREIVADNVTMFQAEPDLPTFDPQGLQMIVSDETDLNILLPTEELPGAEPAKEQVTPKKGVPDSTVPGAPQRGVPKEKDADITVVQEKPPAKRPRIIPLVLPPIESPRRRRHVRHLKVDVDICINKKDILQNIVNTRDIVRNIQDVQVCHPLLLASTFKELFKNPARKELRQKLLFPLWARNLKQVEDFSETESDQKRPIFCVPELVLSTESSSTPRSDQLQDLSSVELPRPSSVVSERQRSSLIERSVTPVSIKSGKSKDSLHESTPRKRRKTQSLSEEETTQIIEQPSIHQLDEELYPLVEEIPVDIPSISISPVNSDEERIPEFRHLQDYIVMNVEKYTQTERWTTFKQICPPGQIKKRRAACLFYALLMAHQNCLIRLKQKEPYGDIYIRLRTTPP